jgi:ABC-type transporter Mla subunit MlaD
VKKIGLKTMMVLALGGMMVVTQTPAYAQFGGLLGGSKKSADAGGATIDKDTFAKSADQAAGNLLAARIAFLDAKAKMMEALGVKADSVAKASEALRAQEGSTSDKVKALDTASKTTADADKEFEAKMAESKELSAESKAKFAEGGGKFIDGVLLEKAQIETIQKLVEQGQSLVQSAGPLQKAGVLSVVKPVTTMSTMVPGDVKEGTSTLSKIIKFAQSQKVEIPGADKATASLGSLN